ncbi:MAG: hypothetical protein ACLSH8_13865 [Zhenhengia sp.]|uniref:hypothetical protein n=1 Tax=Zhenhengia sp. TaxID=2944208 RepID=UPI0029076E3C|nr:hypothetical protein [Clostridiales bacterium]MDU6854471.1 hypothetical protein [Clostridiales bacterium]MDU6974418.1 hypothetical protein [Clostridiales bacterium]
MRIKKILSMVLVVSIIIFLLSGCASYSNYTNSNLLNESYENESFNNSIIVSEGDFTLFYNSFNQSIDKNYYISKDEFLKWQKVEDSHDWSNTATIINKYIYDFANDQDSDCYRIWNIYKRDCIETDCGVTQFFAVWEYDKKHSWNGLICENVISTENCNAIKNWIIYRNAANTKCKVKELD